MGAESAASPVDGNVPAGIAPSLAPWLFNGGRWSGPSRHLLGGARSSQTPAHAAPVQPLPWVCRSRPSAAPSVTAPSSLLLRSCQPQPQTLALRSFLPSLQGGLVREAAVGRRRRECDFVGIKGAPSSPRSSSEGGLAPSQFQSHSCWRRAMSNPVLAPWRSVLRSCLASISPPPCRVPPKSAAPRATAMRV